jgi:hypothetical protein
LLSQPNQETAARSIGVSAKTLQRWLKEPSFQEAYADARRAAFGQCLARLQQASSAAVLTLLRIMYDLNAPPATRVRAANDVLNLAIRAMEVEDVGERVTKLEQTLKWVENNEAKNKN